MNRDGAFNNLDIAPFVALLTGGRSAATTSPLAGVSRRPPMRVPLFSDAAPLRLASDDVLPISGTSSTLPTRAAVLVR
ncbi:MAG TPA: hypothetical protein PJ994_07785 [Tepidiformaceae bacterium]|nr:hypothetical protein [Tepidiformaceae bacterium]